jgi:hypothetical protein
MKCIVLDTLHCRPTLPDGGEGAWARVGACGFILRRRRRIIYFVIRQSLASSLLLR